MKRALGLLAGAVLIVLAFYMAKRAQDAEISLDTRTAAETTANQIAWRDISASELAGMMKRKDFVLVNVHIPYQGEIPGTDVFLPYDAIEANLDKLPADKGAKIVVYCRSGRMSVQAVQTLASLGYTNIYNLTGGWNAWVQAGNEFSRQGLDNNNKNRPGCRVVLSMGPVAAYGRPCRECRGGGHPGESQRLARM